MSLGRGSMPIERRGGERERARLAAVVEESRCLPASREALVTVAWREPAPVVPAWREAEASTLCA